MLGVRAFEAMAGRTDLEGRFEALRHAMELPAGVGMFYAYGAPLDDGDTPRGPRPVTMKADPLTDRWWQAYRADDSVRMRDPVRRAIRRGLAPILWNDLAPDPDLGRCCDPLWRQVRDCGILKAVSVPLHDPRERVYGSLAVVCFEGPSDFDDWMRGGGDSLVALSYGFHFGLMRDDDAAPMRPALADLSRRERECLVLVSEGMSSKQIARRLGLSPRTVDLHVARAIRRLGARNRAEAVSRALGRPQAGPRPAGSGSLR